MKMHKQLIAGLAILISVSLGSLAADQKAQVKQGAQNETLQMQADSFAYNAETKEMVASGHVVITMKNGSRLKAEKVIVKTSKEGTTIVAEKEVTFEKQTEGNK